MIRRLVDMCSQIRLCAVRSDCFGRGLNTYAYVSGNPLALIDPRGLNPFQASPVSTLEAAVIEGDAAQVEMLAEIAGLSDATLMSRTAANANKIAHIFGRAEHNVDPLVKACGSKGKALVAMRTAAEKAAKSLGDGLVKRMAVTANGVSFQVNGVVANGIFYLGTGFIP